MLMYVSEINLFLKVLVLLLTFLKKGIRKKIVVSFQNALDGRHHVMWFDYLVWCYDYIFPLNRNCDSNLKIYHSLYGFVICFNVSSPEINGKVILHKCIILYENVEHPNITQHRSIQVFQFTYVSVVLCQAILQNGN